MNEFYSTGASQDPYEVQGQERADRFVFNFKGQELLGASGVLEQAAILREAQLSLSKQHFNRFCDRIGLPPGSSGFTTMGLIDQRYRELSSLFDTQLAATAFLHLIVSRPEVFEKIVHQGSSLFYMDASEIRENINEASIL
jgi:hypothetical protein